MELIKSVTRRSRVSELLYVVLNVGFAGLLLLLVQLFPDPWPWIAFLVVIMSKWRIFAVRPRFWIANIQTNLGDMLLGFAVVALIWLHSGQLPLQLLITALYVAWLVIIKPKSKRRWVVIQAGIMHFVTLMALLSFTYRLPAAVMVGSGWLIAYISAKHILSAYDSEKNLMFLSMAWGVIVAQLSWLAYYWTAAYSALFLPQLAIIATLLGYLAYVCYASHERNDGIISKQDVVPAAVFVSMASVLLLVIFNDFGNINL
ncbi:hypothetical protein B7Z17_03270 [Candidatus Saccharibacteria bacterium 32-49-10]|nr:MAG: hypothetical protein B7Z17_03270 [Candidatus Saccharibacteria bacterium 32-49-10]